MTPHNPPVALTEGEADCPDCGLPHPSRNPYCFCKPPTPDDALSRHMFGDHRDGGAEGKTLAHPDDLAVDRFAAAMKAKLAAARTKGRGGWDDPEQCSDEYLAKLLVEHLGKGNPGTFEDIGNFAMMLHQRGADPNVFQSTSWVEWQQSRLWREMR